MIQLTNVSKIFGTGVAGLSEVSLEIDPGEFVFLVGHTGSGKTTLLRLLVRDMLPTSGTIVVGDFDIVKLPANKIPHLRKKVGVVFQDLKLLMDRTIIENIALPMQVAGKDVAMATKRGEELLDMVGLSSHRDKFPVQLSGGELQRVAIARALALAPDILLADEPTGNLDPDTAMEIVELLTKINETGTTIVMATHNLDIVGKMKKRVVHLDKGKLTKDEGKSTKSPKEDKKEEKRGAQQDISEESFSEEVQTPEDAVKEEHKKETKKLSDLLAKARQTLHQGSGQTNKKDEKEKMPQIKNDDTMDGMPFGFEKEADIKDTNSEKEEKKEKK